MGDFYIQLPSNVKHPSRENKTSFYYTELPQVLKLPGEWEVGLSEVHMPISFYNFPEHPRQHRRIVLERRTFNLKKGIKNVKSLNDIENLKRGFISTEIPYGNYENLQQLVRSINKALKEIISLGETLSTGKGSKIAKHKLSPYIRVEDQNLKPILYVGRGEKVMMSQYLAALLRYEEDHIVQEDHIEKTRDNLIFKGPSLESLDDFKILLNDRSTEGLHYRTFNPIGVPYLEHYSSNIYIYTDIIENDVVGDVEVPLLRSVRCTGKFGEELREIFVSPYYKKIKKHEIPEIMIAIYDDVGQLVKFEYGNVSLTLHFRCYKE